MRRVSLRGHLPRLRLGPSQEPDVTCLRRNTPAVYATGNGFRAAISLASVFVVGFMIAGKANSHSGGWAITRGGAQHLLLTTTLYPRGDYEGVVIDAVRARCVGDFNSPSFIRNNQRYFNHLTCTLTDVQRRRWSLRFHATGRSSWQYSNLKEGDAQRATGSREYVFRTPGQAAYCYILITQNSLSGMGCLTPNDGFFVDITSALGSSRASVTHSYSSAYKSYRDARVRLLDFGENWASSDAEVYRCESRSSGLTCRHSASGHGFWLGRYYGYRIF